MSLFRNLQRRGVATYSLQKFLIKNPPVQTDTYIKSVHETGSLQLFKWEHRGRRNDYTLEQADQDVKESFERTKAFSQLYDEDRELLRDTFGWNDEEINCAFDLNHMENFLFDEDRKPRWDNWVKLYGQSPTMRDLIKNCQSKYEDLRVAFRKTREVDIETMKKSLESFEVMEQCEGKIPQDSLEQLREQTRILLEAYDHPLDVNAMKDAVRHQMGRAFQEVADCLGEWKKELLDKPTEKIIHYAPMFERDEYGCLRWSFQSLEFIEKFFPDVRDQALREMDAQIWRIQNEEEEKKQVISLEDLVVMFHKRTRGLDCEANDPVLATGSKTDPKARELEQMLISVNKTLDELTQLTREVNTLKSQAETAAEKNRKKKSHDATGKAADDEKQSGYTKEEFWRSVHLVAKKTREEIAGSGGERDVRPIDPLTGEPFDPKAALQQ